MTLSMFLKVNVLAGVVGSLVMMPFAYLYEVIASGWHDSLVKFHFVDAAMILVLPVLVGFGFAVTALVAYPVVAYLHRKGLVSLE